MKLLNFLRPSRLHRGLPSSHFVGANLVFARVFRAIGQGRTQGSPLLRRGSVLIMCVVLIVILALIGTAMLTTARIDRATATQHSYNVQVDLLIEGARNIAKSVILSDLYGIDASAQQFLRPVNEQSAATPLTSFENWDAPLMDTSTMPPLQNDRWLASLLPRMLVEEASPLPPTPLSPVYWDAITGPLVGTGTVVFEDPTQTQANGAPLTYTNQVYMAPTVRRVTNPDGSVESLPALVPLIPTPAPTAIPYVAADADGDGIADSLLCRMLPGELNGVTYYVAMRIVDNAAKVNVNTAWSQENEWADLNGVVAMFGAAVPPGNPFAGNLGVFPTHMGLMEMLRTRVLPSPTAPPRQDPNALNEMKSLNQYRFGYPLVVPTLPIQFSASLTAMDDPAMPGTPGTPRGDYNFSTQGDAIFYQLARRLGNPGWGLEMPVGANPQRYEPFTASESAALAYRFVLPNIDSSRSDLETQFYNAFRLSSSPSNVTEREPDSLVRSAPNFAPQSPPWPAGQVPQLPMAGRKAYQPDEVVLWYDQNFNFDRAIDTVPNVPGLAPGQKVYLDDPPNWPVAYQPVPAEYQPYPRSIRPLITTSNPQALLTPVHDLNLPVPRGVATSFKTDDQVAEPLLMPNYSGGPGGMPAARSRAKTDVNTARFGELWSAFWNVMVDQTEEADRLGIPFKVPSTLITNYAEFTYYGNGFDFDTFAPVDPPLLKGHPAQMFRSPLREMRQEAGGAVGVFMEPNQVMLLRSAIAAVNTEDLRDSDTIPTKRSITLEVKVDGQPINAMVDIYGIEPQPYITEVYVNNDASTDFAGGRNPKGYVAIELYNPYPVAIDMKDWVLAVVDRRWKTEGAPAPGPGQQGSNAYPEPPINSNQAGLSYFYIHNGPRSHSDGGGITPPTPLPAGTVVPPYGFLVLHNLPAPGTPGNPDEDAIFFPSTRNPTGPAGAVYVQNLHWVMRDSVSEDPVELKELRGGELVILRPVNVVTPGPPPVFEPALLEERNCAPVDSFDFTGMVSGRRSIDDFANGDPASAALSSWHYMRSTGAMANQPNWRFVYPGRYTAEFDKRRQQGTSEQAWMMNNEDPEIDAVHAGLGAPNIQATFHPYVQTIQVFDQAGPQFIPAMPNNQFPFGGFMRNGDILQIPFIGSYAVRLPTTPGDPLSTLEVNPITIDSAFANDTDPENNEDGDPAMVKEGREQVGRFCPLRIRAANGDGIYDDLNPVGDFDADRTITTNKWRYRWAIDLFDYLTVGSPGNDYAPNIPTFGDPATPPALAGGPRKAVDNDGDGKFGDVDVTTPNTPAGHSPGNEDAVPVHGLININTAPWRVLAAIPWVPYGQNEMYKFDESTGLFTSPATGDTVPDNIDIAKAIVSWRDGNPAVPATMVDARAASGPFRSIFDLYRVHDNPTDPTNRVYIFNKIQNDLGNADDAQGDFSPFNGATGPAMPDGVRGDFEEQYLILNRISNLITTRSDSFTVYIQVQGWVGVGGPGAKMVVQRRAAFIQDRHSVNLKEESLPQPTNVPTD